VIDGNFKLYYTADATRGLIYVYVDGVYLATINQYSATTKYQKVWVSPILGAGEHTLRFEHKTKKVSIDAIEVIENDPPAAISDLNASNTGMNPGNVELTWTSVGDDDLTGTASSYLVRYSLNPITTENDWNNAIAFSNTKVPQVSGNLESLTVSGLDPRLTYHFAIKTRDEAGNLGGLSSGTTTSARSIASQRWPLANTMTPMAPGCTLALGPLAPIHQLISATITSQAKSATEPRS